MNTLTAVLAIARIKGPIHRWGVHKEMENYPSMGLSRTTIYRNVDKATGDGLLRYEGDAPGRSKDRQMFSITEMGREHLIKRLKDTNVGAYNMRSPNMYLYQFVDYLALVKKVEPTLVDVMINRRALSIRLALEKGMESSEVEGLEILERGLRLQYHTELYALEDILTINRQNHSHERNNR